MKNENIYLSVVVPMYNEAENIEAFFQRTTTVLQALNIRYEIIAVDDGSRDGTLALLENLSCQTSNFRFISFSRNFGKETALLAGLEHTQGEYVVPIDADLQHPPEAIIDLLTKAKEGYDMVYAVKDSRHTEGLFKRTTARLFYKFINMLSAVDIVPDAGDFRVMNRKVVNSLCSMRENERFTKGLYSWIGFRSASISFKQEERFAGKSKWNYWSLFKLALSGVTSFSVVPLRLGIYLGFISATGGMLYGCYVAFKTIFFGDAVRGFPTLALLIIFFGGVQLITMGILGEYLRHIFIETKQRPIYIVQHSKNLDFDSSRNYGR